MAIFVAIARPTPSRKVWSPERTSNCLAVAGLVCVVGATKLVVVCASNKRLVVSLILAGGWVWMQPWLWMQQNVAARCGYCNENSLPRGTGSEMN